MDDIYDPTNPRFSEPILKRLGNAGFLPSKIKLILIGPILYIIGVVVTAVSNTLALFLADYAFSVATLLLGVGLYLAIHACRQVNPTISKLDLALEHSSNMEFRRWAAEWPREESAKRYYLWIFFSVSYPVIACFFGFIGPPWVKEVTSTAKGINKAYYLLWCGVMGYFIGVGFNRLNRYARTIYRYSKKFCTKSRINLLSSDGLGGLKSLGRLALKVNVAIALPGFVGVVYILKTLTERGSPLINLPTYAFMATIYMIVLVGIFIFPLRPVHKAMLEARKKMQKDIAERLEKTPSTRSPETIQLLSNLLICREQVSRIPTWPLDLNLTTKFLTTAIGPLIGGALLQILFERLLTP